MSLIEAHNRLSLDALRGAYLPPVSPPLPYSIALETSKTLPGDVFKDCFGLVRGMEGMYRRATGWSPAAKKQEMMDPDMRYLVLLSSSPSSSSSATCTVGFLSFMITEEAEKEVIYWSCCPLHPLLTYRQLTERSYELHLVEGARGKGLGTILVDAMETYGRNVGVERAMLTVFIENEAGRRFYSRLGYEVDEISPTEEDFELWGKGGAASYVILSKEL